ncbi:MAG: hypothetical protein HRT71_04265 [Flavobacteriales bacterium]|nr:hypothetical protein [Flavobacteriales bacterium]
MKIILLKRVRTAIVSLIILSSASVGYTQSNSYNEADVVDEIKGIYVYDKLSTKMGGDSIRNCDGYGCDGWVEDFYSTGEILHKGYYENGEVTTYKNYYKNGNVERQFKSFDDIKSSMKTYFPEDVIKTEIAYKYGYQFKRDDYLNNGAHTLVYQEEYHKSGDYFLLKKSYFDSGKLKASFELTNAKKKLFSDMSFYETGSTKLEGKHKYDDSIFEYVKIGKWTFFNDKGDPSKEQTYVDGELDKEKVY